MGKRKNKTPRLECHGGPKDGDWMDCAEGVQRIYLSLDRPAELVQLSQSDVARIGHVRIGIYQVTGYRFKGERCAVLKWMGEGE